jgi:galactose mutarotase-like enzyme
MSGCVGYDNAFIFDNNTGTSPAFSLWSTNSGIRMDVTTNQAAVQVRPFLLLLHVCLH